MISVITCSVDPEKCAKMLESVRRTIGVHHEELVWDNRKFNFGLCRVYNLGAEKAKFPFLCFIHEDVIMEKEGWGRDLVQFASLTPNCGVIGCAGGIALPRNFMMWGLNGLDGHNPCHYIDANGKTYFNPNNELFSKCVCLDGLFLFAPKIAWDTYQFDEITFPGFHCYDADWTFGVSRTRQNYAWLAGGVHHYNKTELTYSYFHACAQFQNKWKSNLPFCLINGSIPEEMEFRLASWIYRNLRKDGHSESSLMRHCIGINGDAFFQKIRNHLANNSIAL
jgi:hypothetical protein